MVGANESGCCGLVGCPYALGLQLEQHCSLYPWMWWLHGDASIDVAGQPPLEVDGSDRMLGYNRVDVCSVMFMGFDCDVVGPQPLEVVGCGRRIICRCCRLMVSVVARHPWRLIVVTR